MEERKVLISFEMDIEDISNMFRYKRDEVDIPGALDEFLKNYFSSYLEIHAKNIRNNMHALKQEIEEKEVQRLVLQYLKNQIEKEDMEQLQSEATKMFFKEAFENKKEPDIAIQDSFQSLKVSEVAESIWKKIRNNYLLLSI